jgi:hypothetical protein
MSINTKTMALPVIIIFIITITMFIWGQGHNSYARHGGSNSANDFDGLRVMLYNSSILQINFDIIYRPTSRFTDTASIKVTGTATGAFLEYFHRRHCYNWAIELDENEWHDFIVFLFHSGLEGGGRDGYTRNRSSQNRRYNIKITAKDGNVLVFPPVNNIQRPLRTFERMDFDREINAFMREIKAKRMELHSAEYEKKFGTPPWRFQSSMCEITISGNNTIIRASLTNTMDSIRAHFDLGVMIRREEGWGTRIHINDWLDIIHAFDTNYRRLPSRLSETGINNRYEDSSRICLSTFDALNETTVGIIAKIKKDSGIDAFEMRLGERYKKRFGVQMSDFERSLINVRFRIRAGRNNRYVEVRRHANGARMTIESSCDFFLPVDIGRYDPTCRNLIDDLDIGEWLDFVRALHEIRTDQWNEFESRRAHNIASVRFLDDLFDEIEFSNCNRHGSERSTWSIDFNFFSNQLLRYSGNNTYPPNWKYLSDLMSNLETRISREVGN